MAIDHHLDKTYESHGTAAPRNTSSHALQYTNLRKPNRKPSETFSKTAKINDVGVPKPSQTFAQTSQMFDQRTEMIRIGVQPVPFGEF